MRRLAAEGGNEAGAAHGVVQGKLDELLALAEGLRTAVENLDRLEPQKEQLDAQITPLREQLEDVTGQIEAIEALVSGGGQLTEEQQAQLSALKATKATLEMTLNGDGTAGNPGLLSLQKQVNAALAAIDGQLAQRGMNRDTARQMLAQLEDAGELPTTAEAVRASYQTLLATRQTLDSSWAESTTTDRPSCGRPSASWTRPGRSWRTPGRSWRTAGRSWRTPGSSWRTPSRSSGTANGSSPTAGRSWTTAGGSTTTAFRSWRTPRQ